MQKTSKFLRGLCLVTAVAVGSATLASSAMAQAQPKNTALQDAQKRITEQQQKVNELKGEQKKIKDKLATQFESKEEFKNTSANFKKAKAEYDAARKAAVTKAQAKPEYKQLAKDKEALQTKYSAAVAARDTDNIAKLGSDVTAKSIAMKKMETDAMDQDEKAVAAKEKYDAAQKEMKSLDDEVEANLQTDPDYAAIQQQVVQAETELKTQRDALEQQRKSEAQAHAAQSKARSAPKTTSGSSRRGGGAY